MGSRKVPTAAWLACALAIGCAEAPGLRDAPEETNQPEETSQTRGRVDGTDVRLDRERQDAKVDAGGNSDTTTDGDEAGVVEAGASDAGEARDVGPSEGSVTGGDGSVDAGSTDAGAQPGPDVQSRFVSFRTSPSIGTQRHSLEFEPKAVICFGAPVTSELPQPGSGGFVAFADGTSTAGIADAMTDDDTVSSRAIDVERGIIIRAGQQQPVVRYAVHLSQSGFALEYDATDGEAYTIGCLAIGGEDVSASLVTSASHVGEVRGLPSRPELIFAITPGDGDNLGGSQGDDHPLNSFGVCDAATLSQWWFGMYSDDRADGKRAHVVEGKIVGETMFWNSAITTVHDDGFAWEAAGGEDTVAFLVLNVSGAPRRVGLLHAESQSDSTALQEIPLGFEPQAMGFVSAAREVLTGVGATDTSHAAQGLGMVDAQLHQATLSRFTELGADNADQRWTEGRALAIPSVDVHHGAQGEVVDMTGPSPTLRWSRGDGRRYRIGYFALGSSAPTHQPE